MEDASAVDLDWFWRGWFYGTEPVDIAIKDVKWFQLNSQNPILEKAFLENQNNQKDIHIGVTRNENDIKETVNEHDSLIDDYYAKRNIYLVDALDKKEYEELKLKTSDKDLALLNSGKHFYEVQFQNLGGMVMPLIIRFTFTDDSTQVFRIPVEIWRQYEAEVSKVFILDKEVKEIRLDPFLETADVNLNNNDWPAVMQPSRYQIFKQNQTKENPMQRQKKVDAIKN
jgi:hypothetical protein